MHAQFYPQWIGNPPPSPDSFNSLVMPLVYFQVPILLNKIKNSLHVKRFGILQIIPNMNVLCKQEQLVDVKLNIYYVLTKQYLTFLNLIVWLDSWLSNNRWVDPSMHLASLNLGRGKLTLSRPFLLNFWQTEKNSQNQHYKRHHPHKCVSNDFESRCIALFGRAWRRWAFAVGPIVRGRRRGVSMVPRCIRCTWEKRGCCCSWRLSWWCYYNACVEWIAIFPAQSMSVKLYKVKMSKEYKIYLGLIFMYNLPKTRIKISLKLRKKRVILILPYYQ